MSVALVRKDDRCNAIVSELIGDMNWLINESSFQDDFVKIISRFNKIFVLMSEVIDILKNLVENKSQAEAIYKLDSVLQRIKFCDNNLDDYVSTSKENIKLYSTN